MALFAAGVLVGILGTCGLLAAIARFVMMPVSLPPSRALELAERERDNGSGV